MRAAVDLQLVDGAGAAHGDAGTPGQVAISHHALNNSRSAW
jgi:hypothetical protein